MQHFWILLGFVALGWLAQCVAWFGWYPEYLCVFSLTFRDFPLFTIVISIYSTIVRHWQPFSQVPWAEEGVLLICTIFCGKSICCMFQSHDSQFHPNISCWFKHPVPATLLLVVVAAIPGFFFSSISAAGNHSLLCTCSRCFSPRLVSVLSWMCYLHSLTLSLFVCIIVAPLLFAWCACVRSCLCSSQVVVFAGWSFLCKFPHLLRVASNSSFPFCKAFKFPRYQVSSGRA